MGLAGDDLRVVVGPTCALAHAYLGERDDVQREVELPITTAWQTVSRVVAAGDLDRCDAGIAGERGGAAEPARTTSPPEQPPRDDGPMPATSRSRVPCASRVSAIWAVSVFSR